MHGHRVVLASAVGADLHPTFWCSADINQPPSGVWCADGTSTSPSVVEGTHIGALPGTDSDLRLVAGPVQRSGGRKRLLMFETVRESVRGYQTPKPDVLRIPGNTQSISTNCVTGMPEARIKDRSVPGANSRCWGMDKLAGCPGLIKMTWLPCCRSLRHPAFCKARTACSPETEGSAAIRREPRPRALRPSEACCWPTAPANNR